MRIKLCYACAEKAKDVYRLDELTGPDKGKCDQCGQTRMVVGYDTHAKRGITNGTSKDAAAEKVNFKALLMKLEMT